MDDRPLVVAMTGASGAVYGRRLLEIALRSGREIHFSLSGAAAQVIDAELGVRVDLMDFDPASFIDAPTGRLRYWHHQDLSAGMASGSFRTAGMVVVPCSMGTLAAVAGGQSRNLIQRAAEVHLKERRKLVLVPRETPLHVMAIENMLRVTRAGAIVLPAAPGFYHRPASIDDLVDFVVARICDHLDLDVDLIHRWGDQSN